MKQFWLKYQKNWLEDKSQIKFAEKGRREGFTYVQSYEDVRDCVVENYFTNNRALKVWFTSADLSAAKEYIDYCREWASFFNCIAKDLGEVLINEEKDIKAYGLEFANGAKIFALSSNPSQFRSKGGKVVIDEFAFHKDQKALWKAAYASAKMWGYPIRVISTHHGQQTLFFKIVQKIKKGELNYSLHTVPIELAVEQGLADKIKKRVLSDEERADFLEELRKDAGDEITWNEEFRCIPVDESTAFLSYEQILKCKEDNVLRENLDDSKDLYLGFDVARSGHKSVMILLEKVENIRYLRQLVVLRNVRFRDQKEILYGFLKMKNLRRACIDATGIGNNLAEDAQIDFGKSKVEAVTFSNSSKEEMATMLYIIIEDRNLRIDSKISPDFIEDFHSVKRITTKAGNIRLDAEESANGHADCFWATALANCAASCANDFQKPEIYTEKKRKLTDFSVSL
ncbi:MAG: hypothetical protein DKM22_05620 [Candidatus Melainabacteria bacterium]|nr:MAG: hypothetical protein DKM22_05620 [Candidatus Melainabacteria bacterium]